MNMLYLPTVMTNWCLCKQAVGWEHTEPARFARENIQYATKVVDYELL